MERNILLVDDQRDILRLLRATLESLKKPELKIFEAPSGEEALIESARRKIDLLITDYKLPGMSGVELMHKLRARHPEAKIILITGMTDRKIREEMLNAGALAIFDKPIPLADFLDVTERGLGLVQTIFPPEKTDEKTEQRHARISDLLANFRQDIGAEAVFLLNERGLVQARTGRLRDESMEVSLFSALMAIHTAGLKIARYNHQDKIDSYHVFRGGNNELIFIPVAPLFALLVAGSGLVTEERILETVNAMLALRKEVERSLKSLGVTGELHTVSPKTVPLATALASRSPAPAPEKAAEKPAEVVPAADMEALFKDAAAKKSQSTDMDDFWNQAAEKHGSKPVSKEVISLEDARKMGLLPGDGN